MGLFDWFEAKIIELLQPIIRPIQPLITIFTKFRDSTIGILDAASQLNDSVRTVIDTVVHFQEQPHIKSRVISLPRVVQNVQELVALPGQIISALEEMWSNLKGKLTPDAFDVEELEGLEDLRAIVTKFGTKISAGFEKILGVVSIIVDSLVTIRTTIDDLQTIVDAVQTVIDDVENLNGIFLPQSNPRKTLQLVEGGSIKVRLGNLH
jgi:hypothetical protein